MARQGTKHSRIQLRALAFCAALIAAPFVTASALLANEFDFTTDTEMSEFVRQDCGACHGLTLKGGLGRPLLKENLEHFDLETIEEVILDGIPDTAMPPWRGLLSEDQVRQIAKALKEGTIQ
ncbi:MAG: cytochrome c [Cohaesibacter sp.]|jgi:cytochrome c55X|nr:cytochrome c [Cohaesibacter sp.]